MLHAPRHHRPILAACLVAAAGALSAPRLSAAQPAVSSAGSGPVVTEPRAPAGALTAPTGGARTKGLGCDRGTAIWADMARPDSLLDDAHPKYFTKIIEVTGSGTSRVPFSYLDDPASHRRGTCETVNADVDVDSRIVIRFDRRWLQRYNRNVVVSVSGELQSGASSPPIEIAGYSEIGKDRPGFATVRGISDVAGTLSGFQLVWTDMKRALDAARDSADLIDRGASAALTRALTVRDSVRRSVDSLRTVQTPGDTAASPQASPQLADAQRALDTATVRLNQLRQRPEYQAEVSPTFVHLSKRIVARRRTQLNLPLAVLAGDGGQLVRATLARQRSIDPETVRQLASQARSLVDTIAASKPPLSAAVPKDRAALETLQETIEIFRGLMASLETMIPPSLQPDADVATQELRDAEVLLSQIGAKAGDVIVLHISDSVPDVVGRRQLDVRLRVRELGWVRRVSDAVLLLRRTSVLADAVDPRVAAARIRFAADGRADPVEDVPLPANYLPAAGGSLLWTYYHRSGGTWYVKALNWLTPGTGINVSFASFPSKTVSFAKPDSAGAPPRETVSLSQDKLQVAAGPVVTLFDSALQFTYGWNLNVPRARQYFGVGFSFINIAKRLGVTLGGAEQAQ